MATRPLFFLVRPGTDFTETESGMRRVPGPKVPLVPVDQLPEWLQIAGFPRELTSDQTIGLTNLGAINRVPDFLDAAVHYEGLMQSLGGVREQHGEPSAAETSARPGAGGDTGMAGGHGPETGQHEKNDTSAMEADLSPRMVQSRGLANSIHADHGSRVGFPEATGSQPPGLSSPQRPANASAHCQVQAGRATAAKKDRARVRDRRQTSVACRHWLYHSSCKWGRDCRHHHAIPAYEPSSPAGNTGPLTTGSRSLAGAAAAMPSAQPNCGIRGVSTGIGEAAAVRKNQRGFCCQ